MNIAIMGATSHIAKGLIDRFLHKGDDHLYLFGRTADKIQHFLNAIGRSGNSNYTICTDYHVFESFSYDVIINCVGVGTLNKHRGDYPAYFMVTEEYDNLAIGYLYQKSPNALYISFSSGAVYGREHSAPVEEHSVNHVKVNQIEPQDYYSIVRLNAEAKHRAFHWLNIIDLRVFSYFSRFIDLADGYFITEVLNCILGKKVLVTDNVNMVRDYLHPDDLYSMIHRCLDAGKINAAFDVMSSKPIEKQEILHYFSSIYGLKHETSQSLGKSSATGSKRIYCSTYHAATRIGYHPQFSSLDTIKHEAEHILSPLGAGDTQNNV
jgi:nucleoside-diphosphate-sugar epimerase